MQVLNIFKNAAPYADINVISETLITKQSGGKKADPVTGARKVMCKSIDKQITRLSERINSNVWPKGKSWMRECKATNTLEVTVKYGSKPIEGLFGKQGSIVSGVPLESASKAFTDLKAAINNGELDDFIVPLKIAANEKLALARAKAKANC